MKKRILITTAKFGSGHIMAAEAMKDAFKKYHKDEVIVKIFDFSEGGNDKLEKFSSALYSYSAAKVPSIYRTYASMMDSHNLLNKINKYFSLVGSQKTFEKAVQDFCPDEVLSVFPITNRVVGKYKKKYNYKFLTCVIDLGTIHNYWIADEVDKYIVNVPEMVAPLQTLYVPKEKIEVVGYPLREKFFEKTDIDNLKTKLKIEKNKFVVMYMLHTAPEKYAEKVCDYLDENPDIQAVLVCGKNAKLKQKFQKKYKNAVVTGFIKNVDEYMKASDLVIGKGGTTFLLETLAVGANLLITSYIAPQEQGNVELILEKNAGFLAGNADDIIQTIQKIQKLTPAQKEKIQKNQKKLITETGAKDIAKYALNVL